MFPLKTLVVAVILAIAFSPQVRACSFHKHEQTVEAPAAPNGPAQAAATTPATPDPATAAPPPAEVASAGQASPQPAPN